MSSTGVCFGVDEGTSHSLDEFERRQNRFAKQHNIPSEHIDYFSDEELLKQFNVYCSEPEVAGNGALMRLAPVPLFFYRSPLHAVEYSGLSGQITHGDRIAYDACRYYGALIVAALCGYKKNQLLDRDFYSKHMTWFGGKPLRTEIKLIAEGSYQKAGGYKDGIRGKGYIVNALEAALWAFWSDGDSFEKGALAAVNLGDDTDTTAAIYGQLAGAYYGYKQLPQRWVKHVYAQRFMLNLSKWITYEGQIWQPSESISSFIPASSSQPPLHETTTETFASKPHSSIQSSQSGAPVPILNSSAYDEKTPAEKNPHRIKLGATASIGSQNQSISLLPPKVLDLDRSLSWSCEDVCDWIQSLGEIYATYVDAFKRHNVDGYRLLHFVDNTALIEFEVNSVYNRQVIIHGIEQLRKKCSVLLPSSIPAISDFYSEFDGDFVPCLHLSDTTYPNNMSCILKPSQDSNHSRLYTQILKWLGPLPSSIDIDQVELILNTDLYRMFLQQMKRTESRQTQQEFQPHLDAESNPTERKRVLNRLQNLTQQVRHNRSVSIVRVWHGCDRTRLPGLLSNGFAALSKLDNGWFGTAMYFTSSAEYAAKYTNSNGCLIMCYVVLLNPFPVITNDAPPGTSSRNFRFYGRGNYSNYQCHYIPVAPVDADTSWDFRPPPNGVQDAPYDEFAVFQQADILPQVVVHLKPRSTSSTSVASYRSPERVFLSKE